jgi:transposase
MRRAVEIVLTNEEQIALTKLAKGRRTPVRLAERSRIVLLAAQGLENREIAEQVGVARGTVGTWRNRFAKSRLTGIEKDLPRSGRKPIKLAAQAARIVETTLHQKPAAATHWSIRTLARHLSVSKSLVERTWNIHRLQPHLVKSFKVSNDKNFVEKVVDIVGLYLNPPEKAMVLSVDEKSQIQALDRTQPSLPMYPGRKGTLTHDYKRNGTTTLFAALDIESGVVIGQCMKRHRHQEWIKFLKHIDASTNPKVDLHIICDNYATHKHPAVMAWLKRNPRFHLHFTPTSASWLNLVERWFRDLTDKRIRRGIFTSVRELIAAIDEYMEAHNDQTESGYRWTATADDIIAKYRRAKAALDKIKTE